MDPFSTTVAAWICLIVLVALAVLSSPTHEGGPRRWSVLMDRLFRPSPLAVDYGKRSEASDDHDEAPFSALNGPERPVFVQPEQLAQAAERATVEAAARALAVGWAGEAAIIEAFFDGVKRGGSRRYTDLRDAVRARAQAHGWKAPELAPPPEPPRVVRVYEGRPDERLVEL